MIEKVAASKVAVEATKQSAILGMPASHAIALGAGIAVGLAACYVGYRYLQKQKAKEVHSERSITELVAKQDVVETFTAQDMVEWFNANQDRFDVKVKRVVATPTEKTMGGLGYKLDSSFEPKKNIVQFFFDSESNKVLKIRLVNFTDIESNLQASLLDNDGMIVLTD